MGILFAMAIIGADFSILNTGWFGSGYFELGAIGDNLRTYNERQAMITGIRKPSDDSKPVKLLTISSLGTKDIEVSSLVRSFRLLITYLTWGKMGAMSIH